MADKVSVCGCQAAGIGPGFFRALRDRLEAGIAACLTACLHSALEQEVTPQGTTY